MNQFNPVELLKSAVATLSETPGEFGAEHANSLQLERASNYVVRMCDESGKSLDEAIKTLGYVDDKTINHIATCEVCIKGMKQFFSLHPTLDKINQSLRITD